MMSLPPSIKSLQDIAIDPLQLTEFFSTQYSSVKIHIDDTCEQDWKDLWWNASQWGELGQKHWRVKYAAAGFIPHMISTSPFFEQDWKKANFSIVVLFARHYAGGVAIMQQQCLQKLRKRSKAFQETNGKNHFFVFTDSRGACSLDGKFKDVDFERHHVIGQHGELFNKNYFFRRGSGPHIRCFDNKRDVNIPTPNIHTMPHEPIYEDVPNVSKVTSSKKSLLMFYAGWNYQTRMNLVNFFSKSSPDIFVRRAVPSNVYQEKIQTAKYCPICGGFSQWTPRLAEAIYFGCVPVILSDEWKLPFSDVVDWNKFSIRVPRTKYKNLANIVKTYNHTLLFNALMKVQPLFRYHLHKFTENDMLPLFVYEAMQKLNYQPTPQATQLFSTIDTERNYNLGMPLKGKKAHVVFAQSKILVHNRNWSCETHDGYFVDCKVEK